MSVYNWCYREIGDSTRFQFILNSRNDRRRIFSDSRILCSTGTGRWEKIDTIIYNIYIKGVIVQTNEWGEPCCLFHIPPFLLILLRIFNFGRFHLVAWNRRRRIVNHIAYWFRIVNIVVWVNLDAAWWRKLNLTLDSLPLVFDGGNVVLHTLKL